MFPDQARLTGIRPQQNEWRVHRMAVWPGLFGRQWGRTGAAGRVRLDQHLDAGAAINALARLAGAMCHCGYQDSPV